MELLDSKKAFEGKIFSRGARKSAVDIQGAGVLGHCGCKVILRLEKNQGAAPPTCPPALTPRLGFPVSPFSGRPPGSQIDSILRIFLNVALL